MYGFKGNCLLYAQTLITADRQDQGQQQELAASASAAAAQQCGVYDYVPDDDSNLYDVVGDGENESAYADIDDVVTAVNQGQGQMMEAYEEKPAVAVPAVRRSDKPRATAGGEDGVADVCSTYVRGNLSMVSNKHIVLLLYHVKYILYTL